jgi:hypothetical protein
MFAADDLAKMARVESAVSLTIKLQDPLEFRDRLPPA